MRSTRSSSWLAVGVACLLMTGLDLAQAQAIYRCGNTYTRVPCADGKALDVGDPRTAAQRNEARQAAAQERRQAADLERERRRAEARDKPAPAASLSPAAAPAASATTAASRQGDKRKPAARRLDPDNTDFIAGIPGKPKSTRAPQP